jgi:putative transposase
VSRQVYYRALQSRKRKQKTSEKTVALVQDIRCLMPRIGTRKLYHLLESDLKNLHVGRDKLFRILKANNLLIKPKRRYHITTDSHHRFRKHKNLIRSININRPEQVWVSDITYIGTRENPSYLAHVTDAYSKRIMGYDVSDNLSLIGALNALKMAIKGRNFIDKLLVHHSDKGLQYCSNDYQELLQKSFLKCSMTEKYDPYENAIAERINGILKQEFEIDKHNVDLALRTSIVRDAIKIYNNLRPHLSNHMLTPSCMHRQNQLQPVRYKKER